MSIPLTASAASAADREAAIATSAEAIRLHREHNILIESGAERVIDRLARRDRPAPATPPALWAWTFVVKDMIDVAGLRTTRGSVLYGSEEAVTTAPCVEKLERAGALLVGKANQHEFAWGVTSQNPHWGDVGNPRHAHLTSGGSSGGTAAAIAAGIARFGLGTDTGGSVRIPAACCGVVGLRPRAGAVPGEGVAPLAPMFDVVGPMAGSVADCARVWRALTGEAAEPPRSLSGLVVGVADGCAQAGRFADLGAEVREIALPQEILTPYWTIMGAQARRTHEATYPRNAAAYSDGVRRKLDGAAGVGHREYRGAVEELSALRTGFSADMSGIDLLVTPTLGGPAPRVGCDEAAIRGEVGRITAVVSALGLPALAIGDLQIVGRSETDVLRAGLCWEAAGGGIPAPR
ncbi:glutamyl-tRNA amidotransferase subunit A [Sphaerisporangium siamense]|uniref:Aspartyl-tRNA(Asn)/glutamyl-tRNA(Gln) amidotransferase subunit A n=1 Tax=Sphaerisporangium siamense TaxID=795645 RepID=A0A7W7G916_9ACTN|nr:amidase [Sphaerisporangium siamense]MBB4698531.1 aspartyl-tRNA(Asn)/glutamyl-tRNA(Gln) amidotransferase subunit A [Sphaerisporangium siamense]GII85408.1 glutamyl-tRNA amidotransferase subunit A [Sphaerisporangium siamense]